MTSYMLDTNLFNYVLDGKLSVQPLRGRHLVVTHIQHDELSAAKGHRADDLREVIKAIAPEQIATELAVWDVSAWDQSKYSAEDGVLEKMLARLRELDAASGKRSRNPFNQDRDALIAETTVKNSLTLISGDANLRQVTMEFGGSAIDFADLATLAP